ncbi:MAG: tol-pal system protein YbgF [Desulfobacterales bacterium]
MNSSVEELKEEFVSDRDQGENIRKLFAGQDADLDDLRSELRKLRGQIEESEFRTDRDFEALRKDLEKTEKKIEDLDEKMDAHGKRIFRLEKFLGMEEDSGFKPSSESGSEERADLDELDEDELYSAAKQAFDDGDHETAVEGFELFLEKFSDSDMADNARFWIGEVFFAETWYEKAILEYEKVIKNYPEANKVPGAYLKQGLAFHKLGENANARLILQTLLQKYPDSDEAKIARRQIAVME